jgi:hypothetical protein
MTRGTEGWRRRESAELSVGSTKRGDKLTRKRLLVRRATIALSALLLFQSAGFSKAARRAGSTTAAPQSVAFEWQLPQEFADPVRAQLGRAVERMTTAPDGSNDRAAPLLAIIVGAAALTVIADAIMSNYRDIRYGGLIVEDSGKHLSIRTDARLPARVIIIKDKRGVAVRELSGQASAKELVESLSKLDAVKPGATAK